MSNRPDTEKASIAICMATFEPDLELLAGQLDSIRDQDFGNWTCVISDDCSSAAGYARIEQLVGDDPRFALSRSGQRLGVYRNFERVLAMVPSDASHVALADQDDRWAPAKLSTLLDRLGRAQLVFSDARVVDRRGRVIKARFGAGAPGAPRDLASLLIRNSVTGAAALFRRGVLEYALPFPELPGEQFHDQWLAAVALCRGEISYLDDTLYDYVQHESAVLGHTAERFSSPKRAHLPFSPAGVQERLPGWREAYFEHWQRLRGMAQALQERFGEELQADRRRSLGHFTMRESSPRLWTWLLVRTLRSTLSRSEMRAADRALLGGLLWRTLLSRRGPSSAISPRP